MLAGIGFTMALLIADLAFEGALLDAAKLGILAASIVSATAGLALLAWLDRPGRDFASISDRTNADGRSHIRSEKKESAV
jgi:NhaA family Na+:H+ antiporter